MMMCKYIQSLVIGAEITIFHPKETIVKGGIVNTVFIIRTEFLHMRNHGLGRNE